MAKCINCQEEILDENDPCYGHWYATPEFPVFHTPEDEDTDGST